MRRVETAKRRARWERRRPFILARVHAFALARLSGLGIREAKRQAAQAEPFPHCADCGRLGFNTGHQECQYPGSVSDG